MVPHGLCGRAPHVAAGGAVATAGRRVRDNGPVTDFSAPARSVPADAVLAAAVELARAAAVETAGDAAARRGAPGRAPGGAWRPRPTRCRPRRSAPSSPTPSPAGCPATSAGTGRSPSPASPGDDAVTVDEVVLLPGDVGAAGPGLGAVARAAAPRRPLRRRRAALDRGRPAAGARLPGRRRLRRRPRGQRRRLRARPRPRARDVRARAARDAVGRWTAGDFGPELVDGPARARPLRDLRLLPAAGRLAAPDGRRLRQRLRPRRRPRRHRRLRLRRAQPGDARASTSHRGGPHGALRHRRTSTSSPTDRWACAATVRR